MNKHKLTEMLEIVREHQKADRLIQGDWIANCELPKWMKYWSERVFEELPVTEAVDWYVQLLEALISFDGDIEVVKHQLAIKRLKNLLPTGNDTVDAAIIGVIDCHRDPANADWYTAESAANSAAVSANRLDRSAAWSAADSSMGSTTDPADWWHTARSLAWLADRTARSAAESAKWSAVNSSEESLAWQRERDWMLEILRNGEETK